MRIFKLLCFLLLNQVILHITACAYSTKQELILRGHTQKINSVAVSPKDTLIASGSWDKTVRIWDSETGECLHVLTGHESAINAVQFSPDNQTLASASWDGTLRIWDITTGVCRHTIENQCGVLSLAYSPNGALIAIGLCDNTIRLILSKTGKFHQEFTTEKISTENQEITSEKTSIIKKGITSLIFTDSRYFVSGSRDGTVRKWSLVEDKAMKLINTHNTNWENSIAADETIVITPHDDLLCITDTTKGSNNFSYRGHSDWISSVTFDKSSIATGSADSDIRIWDKNTNKCLSILKGHEGPVTSVKFNSTGTSLVSASTDGTVRIWQRQI
jgi:hypothetical protein